MLVFCHLFVGAAIGLALARATGDRRLVAAGLVAGILPDLIDKPLGHLLLASTLDNGRLVAHSLAFLLVVVAAVPLLRGRRPLLAAALGLGILSHQLLDAMWRDPSAWFFPLLGPFVPGHYPDYFLSGLMAELASPTEWLFGVALLTLVLAAVRPSAVPAGIADSARRLLPVLALGIGLAGLIVLAGGTAGLATSLAPGLRPADAVLLGLGALGGALIVYGERDRPLAEGPG